MGEYNLYPSRRAVSSRLSQGSGQSVAFKARAAGAYTDVPVTDFSSDMRSYDRLARHLDRSAGIKETLSVSVPDSSTSRVSVSPARQRREVLANSQARMAIRRGGDMKAASMGAAAVD